MFYVSSISGSKIGVTDTADGVEEFVTKDGISCYLARGVFILGASISQNGSVKVAPICKEASKFLYMSSGTPVQVKLSESLPFKQFIFVRYDADGVMLYDGTVSKFTYYFIGFSF